MSDAITPPLVSVIATVRDLQAYVGETLFSLRHQSFTDFEVVYCDDGSRDATLLVLESYAKLDQRFRHVHHPNSLGCAAGLNTATRASHGEIIVVASGDDIYEEHRVKRAVEYFAKHPEIDVFYENFLVGDASLQQGYAKEVEPFVLEEYLKMNENGRANQVVPHGFSSYRRKVAKAVSYDESRRVGIDFPFFAEVAKAGFKFGYVNDIGKTGQPNMGGGIYRQRPKSVTALHQDEIRAQDKAYVGQ